MNPIWFVLIVPAIPCIVFLIVKYGTYGYYKGKSLANRKEVHPPPNDNRVEG